MELPEQRQTTSDAVLGPEVVRFWMNLMQFRVEFQGKCTEMSLHITTGLAGVVAAAAITAIANKIDFAKDFPKFYLPIVLVFGLYGLIQTLILTNYIYHTYALRGTECYTACLIRNLKNAFGSAEFQKLSKDIDNLNPVRRKIFTFARFLVLRFQPLVIYVSAAFGWAVASIFFCCYCQWKWWAIAIVILLCLSLLMLARLHRLAVNPNFANYLVHKFFDENPYCSAALTVHEKTPDVSCLSRRSSSASPPPPSLCSRR